MVLFHTFWVQTDFAFFAFEDGLSSILLTSTIFRFTFHNHMTQGVKFYSCPCYSRGVERLCSLVSAILSKGFKHKFLVIPLNQFRNNLQPFFFYWGFLSRITGLQGTLVLVPLPPASQAIKHKPSKYCRELISALR